MSLTLDKDILVERSGFTLGPLRLGAIEPGCTVIAGNNGAGKSTLFGALMRTLGNRVHMLPQTFTLPPLATAGSLADFVAVQRGTPPAAARAALDAVQLKPEQRVRSLSGGMHRRLGIALTLIGDPELLIVDEPTTGLDLTQREAIIEILREIAQTRPVLMASHIVADIVDLADRILLLKEGQLVFDGAPAAFIAEHSSFEAAYREATA